MYIILSWWPVGAWGLMQSQGTSKLFDVIGAPVAQLDRATVYGTVGWGFESSRAYHFSS